jgi:hypothetical protein
MLFCALTTEIDKAAAPARNGGSRATTATNGGHAARSSFLAKGQLGAHLDGDGHEGHE